MVRIIRVYRLCISCPRKDRVIEHRRFALVCDIPKSEFLGGNRIRIVFLYVQVSVIGTGTVAVVVDDLPGRACCLPFKNDTGSRHGLGRRRGLEILYGFVCESEHDLPRLIMLVIVLSVFEIAPEHVEIHRLGLCHVRGFDFLRRVYD